MKFWNVTLGIGDVKIKGYMPKGLFLHIPHQYEGEEKVSNRFNYVKYDSQAMETQQELKEAFEKVEALADKLADGRAKALVFTKLEEAYMWTGKAIRDDQIERTGKVDEQPERSNG